MSDFDKLKNALKRGKFVVLEKTKDGGIKFGSSFDYDADIISSKYSPANPNYAEALPNHVFVEQRCLTYIP